MILFSKAVSSPAMRWIMQAGLPLLAGDQLAYFWLTLGVLYARHGSYICSSIQFIDISNGVSIRHPSATL